MPAPACACACTARAWLPCCKHAPMLELAHCPAHLRHAPRIPAPAVRIAHHVANVQANSRSPQVFTKFVSLIASTPTVQTGAAAQKTCPHTNAPEYALNLRLPCNSSACSATCLHMGARTCLGSAVLPAIVPCPHLHPADSALALVHLPVCSATHGSRW